MGPIRKTLVERNYAKYFNMLKSVLINRSLIYLATLAILSIQCVNGTGEKSLYRFNQSALLTKLEPRMEQLSLIPFNRLPTAGSCHLYGHSCLGAHGKRSNELSQPAGARRLVPQDLDKYSLQMPTLEDQIVNNRLYRLINYIKSGANLNSQLNGGSSSLPLTSAGSPISPKLSPLEQLSQQLSKRYDATRPNYDEFMKAYLKRSNDFLNKNSKKSADIDDYAELY